MSRSLKNINLDLEIDLDSINNTNDINTTKKVNKSNMIDLDNLDNLDDKTKQAYDDLFRGNLDLYKLIGASPNDPQDVIKKKCNEKRKEIHPDKVNARLKEKLKKLSEEERKKTLRDLSKQYELIIEAINVLSNPDKRQYYDLQRKTIESKNFVKQRDSFQEFIKLQESAITEESRKYAELEYQKHFNEFDMKHGFDRTKLDDKPLDKDEMNKRLNDIMMDRESQDIDFVPINLFEDGKFNPIIFNKKWEQMKAKENKRHTNKYNSDKSVVKWHGVGASNDIGMTNDQYTSLNSDYSDLYTDVHYDSSNYAKKYDYDDELDEDDLNISDEDLDIDVSYVTDYDKNKELTMKKYDELMKQRQMENEFYDKRELGDSSSWKPATENPFSISNDFGTLLGNDVLSSSMMRPKAMIDKETLDVYKRLVYDNDESNN